MGLLGQVLPPYLSILLGELGDLLLGLSHVVPHQQGAGWAPVLQQWGEGVGVPWQHPQAMPLQGTGSGWKLQQTSPASTPGRQQYLQLQLCIDLRT